MNRFLIFFVLSVLLNLGSGYDLQKRIDKNNNETIVQYKTMAAKIDGNLVVSTHDVDIVTNKTDFRKITSCGLIVNKPNETMPDWSNNLLKTESSSKVINDWSNQVHEYTNQVMFEFNTAERTKVAIVYSGVENTDGIPPNLVSTLNKNTSVVFEAILRAPSVDNNFVRTVGFYQYAKNDGVTFLNLPLLIDNMSMTVVFSETNELDKLDVAKLINPTDYKTDLISVALPTFSVETFVNLREVFDKKNGTQDVEADGTKIHQTTTFKLSGVEEGDKTSNDLPQKEFLVDRPFIFYVKIKDLIVFMGRISAKNV